MPHTELPPLAFGAAKNDVTDASNLYNLLARRSDLTVLFQALASVGDLEQFKGERAPPFWVLGLSGACNLQALPSCAVSITTPISRVRAT
jgi:hypothetical protein